MFRRAAGTAKIARHESGRAIALDLDRIAATPGFEVEVARFEDVEPLVSRLSLYIRYETVNYSTSVALLSNWCDPCFDCLNALAAKFLTFSGIGEYVDTCTAV